MDKPDVGILSMQRIRNYGSFLQAYALKCMIEDAGGRVQFVDYHPGRTLVPADGGTGLQRKLSKISEAMKGKAPLTEKIRFIRYKKNYDRNYAPLLGITGKRNYSPDLDLLVIGSDEVFNCVQNNTNVGFCPELFGQDQHARKMISYAASFGNTTLDRIEHFGVGSQISGWLSHFDALSVRDRNSGSIVRSLTGREPEYHLDPVLAYDFPGRCGRIPDHVHEKDYMLLYGYSSRFSESECRVIRKFARRHGLKIFCIGGVQDCCDRFIDCDPFTVIAYFQHAKYVVTDTFHGSILSIICRKPFAALVREEGYGNSEKLDDLLARLKLQDRKLSDIRMLEKMMRTPVCYEDAEKKIEEERERSSSYLKKWVQSCG